MARYDEDLHENPFFNTLVTKYNIMFSEAAEKKWMVSIKTCHSSNCCQRALGEHDGVGKGGRGVWPMLVKVRYTD